MTLFAITHPVASVARGIETLTLTERNSKNLLVSGSCAIVSRAISLTVFPVFLFLELTLKRIPKLFLAINNPEKLNKRADKIIKYTLAILCSPLGLYAPDGVPGFFLKLSPESAVRPFGVEGLYGKQVNGIEYPRSEKDVQNLVLTAKQEKKQISVIGAGMSQGTQTVPLHKAHHMVIHTRYLNTIEIAEDGQTVTVGAGTTWEQLQLALNARGKSAIVKQASDPFSIGGSIGINCHGWAHKDGAIASTVETLEVIDADGNLHTLRPGDELFGCMFGTLGYFGVITKATLRIVDNEELIEQTEEIELDQFQEKYNALKEREDVPLFGGRLVLDQLNGEPLRKVCMERFEKAGAAVGKPSPRFAPESKQGTRLERIALKLISHLSNHAVRRLLSWFWNKERTNMLNNGRRLTRNEALHPPINAFKMLHHSHLHTQWLQEYFIKPENLSNFIDFLGGKLKANDVRLINATIRPTPKDNISVLPYAEQDRYAVVLCFAQIKSNEEIAKTQRWMESVNDYLVRNKDIYYQAYMPFATREQFEECYGEVRVANLRRLKKQYDPQHRFGNAHTAKYFDARIDA